MNLNFAEVKSTGLCDGRHFAVDNSANVNYFASFSDELLEILLLSDTSIILGCRVVGWLGS